MPGLQQNRLVQTASVGEVKQPVRLVAEDGHRNVVEKKSGTIMRVIHVVKHCQYGNGNVYVAVDLACVQAQAGYEVAFISSGGTFEKMLPENGVQHITLPHEQNKPWQLLKAAWQLARLARKMKADVIHAHMMSSAIIGYIASILTGVPLVTTVHNSFDRHSMIMRLGKRAVAVSQAEKEHLVRRGYKVGKVDVVMNAANHSPREKFMENGAEVHLQSPCITAACGLHRRKGVFDLIAACEIVFKDLPQWRLYIAGEGPDRALLEEQVQSAGIADRVIFLGFIPTPRPLMERSDIFVLASYADPGSLSIGEARAAGCAIVATAVGGTPEMLEFGKAGRLVSPGNPEQLAAELRSLMRSPKVLSDMRKAARNGSEVFNVHRLVGDYEQIYRKAQGKD